MHFDCMPEHASSMKYRVNKSIINYVLVSLVSLWLVTSCGGGAGADGPTVTLIASSETIALGESIELSWQVSGTQPITLSLSPPVGGELVSPLTISPTETTTYRLTASNAEGASNASVTIIVTDVDTPSINIFQAITTTLTLGKDFAWSIASSEPVACTLDVGDGSPLVSFDDCVTTTRSFHTYQEVGTYTATLTLATGARETLEVVITEVPEDVLIGGFVDEQSRNVIIIMTDEDGTEHAVSLDGLNSAIATVEASYGIMSDQPAIRGNNAAVFGLLQTQQDMMMTNSAPIVDIGREFVVAVLASGEVVATSPLERLEADPTATSHGIINTRFRFDLSIPSEQTVALLVAEPDDDGNWICKGPLEYQTLDGQRTVASSQTLYRFPFDFAANPTPYNVGRFQFNELTANLASRTLATRNDVMQDDLPSIEVDVATNLANTSEFQDGLYRFCANPNIARNEIVADIDWRSDIFNVNTLPPETNLDLAQGEPAVYDFSMAFLLETITEQDEDGNTVTINRLLGTSPMDENGNLQVDLVRQAEANVNATLFFTDVAFFDASKQRFPLTPSYEFDASVQFSNTQTLESQRLNPDDPPTPERIDLGVVDGGLGYIQGRVLDVNDQPVADANVIIVLDGERLAFNVATTDDDGVYEIFIPSDTANSYILYAQNASATLAGIAGNDDTGVRFNVPGSRIFDQDIVLDVPLPGATPPASQQPTADAGDDLETLVGTELSLTGSVADPDGDSLIVRWQLISRPERSSASLTSVVTTTTSFTPDVAGDYVLRLLAFDGEAIGTDTITVTALDSAAPDSVRFVLPSGFIILAEGGPAANLVLERPTASQADLTVQLQLLPGSSADMNDIAITGATNLDGGVYEVTLPEGIQQVPISIQALIDNLAESSELLVLELVASTDYNVINPAEASFILLDASPTLTTCDAVVATTQSDIDALANCQTIDGDLVIDPRAVVLTQNDDINSLAPLSNLVVVRGDVLVINTSALTTLGGLDALVSVGGSLSVKSNRALVNLTGLGQVSVIDEDVVIAGNSRLASLDNLSRLTSIGGSLYIGYDNATQTLAGNPNLGDLTALARLTAADISGPEIIISANSLLDCPAQNLAFENAVTVSEGNFVNCNELDIILMPPSITSFTASPNVVTEGGTSALSWTVTGSEPIELSISPDIGNVSGLNSVEITPTITRIYTLTATNSEGSVSQTVLVGVNSGVTPAAPTIVSFTASPSTIELGESSILNWEVASTEPVTFEISPEVEGIEVLDSTGSVVVNPTETTTYTLTASNSAGSVQAQVEVAVNPVLLPTIVAFSASPSTIDLDSSSILSWDVDGTEPITLEITPDIGDVSGLDSVEVDPNVTTTYTLTATNNGGSVNQSVTVFVDVPPTINTFSASPASILQGETSTLIWEVTGTEPLTVEITPDIAGDFRALDQTVVMPTATTTYRLRATNSVDSAEAEIEVSVLRDCSGELVFDQADLNSLADCGRIMDNLIIADGARVNDLSPLDDLIEIRGDLVIAFINTLASLNGLDNLARVDGVLQISGNNNLLNLDALSNLTTVGGNITIDFNSSLQSIAGLAGITAYNNNNEVEITLNPLLICTPLQFEVDSSFSNQVNCPIR